MNKYERIREARRTGEVCGRCGERFTPGEFRGVAHEPYLGQYTVHTPHEPDRFLDTDGTELLGGHACHGCGAHFVDCAPFTTDDGTPWHERLPVCSDRCRDRVRKRVRSGGPAWAGDRECGHCGASIAHLRTDARFCSGRCKTAARRAASS